VIGLTSVLLFEGGVEVDTARREIHGLDPGTCFGRAENALHALVFPLVAERPGVADIVQGDHDLFEVDVAVTDTAEVPEAARITELGMTTEHTDRAIAVTPPRVLHVHMEDLFGKRVDELHVVDTLVTQM